MRALFSERERPFYGQARPLELPPLPVHEAARDIEALLTADGLESAGAVDEVLAVTRGHPQRTLLLAHHLYNLLDGPNPPRTSRPLQSTFHSARPAMPIRPSGTVSGAPSGSSCWRWPTDRRQPAAESPRNIGLRAPRSKTHSIA